MKNIFYAFLLIPFLALTACNKDNSNSAPAAGTFDRKAMLTFYADDFIRPAFSNLQGGAEALKTAIEAFTDAPNLNNLDVAKSTWITAYSRFMQANAYNFGPAGEEGIRKGLAEETGTWPVNTVAVESNISAGNNVLTDAKRDNRGFHALEYLLWGSTGNGSDVVAAFQNDPKRRAHLRALVVKMVQQITDVATAWNGPYRSTFINADGTSAGSSASQLYNEFVRSYEVLKNFGLAVPLGNVAGQTAPAPEKTGAYYSGQSLRFYREHFTALYRFWQGNALTGLVGPGFAAYLQSVSGGANLVEQTKTQASAIQNAFDAVPQSPAVSVQIQNGATGPLQALSTELQKGTRYYKSEMSSLLGIAITFSSGDGD